MSIVMSDEGGGHESFFWENQPWAFSSSDNNSAGAGIGNEGKSKLPASPMVLSSDHPAPLPQAVTGGKRKISGPPKGVIKRDGMSCQIMGSEAKDVGGDGDGDGGESDHEMHIWTERERRKKMRNMFSSLHALLPHLPPKV